MDIPVLEKRPGESRLYTFDFTANLADDEAIDNVVDVDIFPEGDPDDEELEIGVAAFAGKKVSVRFSDGTDGEVYRIEVTVHTTLGNTLIGEGRLQVKRGG